MQALMKRLHTYSQHFLKNPAFVKELIGHSSIKKTDIVYDIGAGSGIISSALSGRCKTVIAIEPEPKTAQLLQKNVAKFDNVTVITDDFLSLDLPSTPYKVFANIPFHLSSPILRKVTETSHPPVAAYFIVQKQFANKLLPDHAGFSSQLGMQLGVRFAFKVRKQLRRTDFWPHPNVDTVLLEMILRDKPLVKITHTKPYNAFIARHFTNPDAFKKLFLAEVGKTPETKPSSLTLDDWVTLFKNSNYS